MSNKDVQDSKVRFTTIKKPDPKRGEAVFLEGINLDKQMVKKDEAIEFYFNGSGVLQLDKDFPFAMKRVNPNGINDFFVKFATAGPGVGRILNPWGVYYSQGDEFKYEKTMGRYRYEFRNVTESVFDKYIKFLNTKNEKHILSAEREANNG